MVWSALLLIWLGRTRERVGRKPQDRHLLGLALALSPTILAGAGAMLSGIHRWTFLAVVSASFLLVVGWTLYWYRTSRE